jgi:hypothetical protein
MSRELPLELNCVAPRTLEPVRPSNRAANLAAGEVTTSVDKSDVDFQQ